MRFRFHDTPGAIIVPVSKATADCGCKEAPIASQGPVQPSTAMARFKVRSRDRWRIQAGIDATVGHVDADGLTPYQRFAARSREKQATA
jgi:hypothetical protein